MNSPIYYSTANVEIQEYFGIPILWYKGSQGSWLICFISFFTIPDFDFNPIIEIVIILAFLEQHKIIYFLKINSKSLDHFMPPKNPFNSLKRGKEKL